MLAHNQIHNYEAIAELRCRSSSSPPCRPEVHNVQPAGTSDPRRVVFWIAMSSRKRDYSELILCLLWCTPPISQYLNKLKLQSWNDHQQSVLDGSDHLLNFRRVGPEAALRASVERRNGTETLADLLTCWGHPIAAGCFLQDNVVGSYSGICALGCRIWIQCAHKFWATAMHPQYRLPFHEN